MKEYIVYREGLLKSIVSDICTFAIMCGSLGASHILVGSTLLDALLIFCMTAFVIGGAARKTVYSAEAMLGYLIKHHPDMFTITEKGTPDAED